MISATYAIVHHCMFAFNSRHSLVIRWLAHLIPPSPRFVNGAATASWTTPDLQFASGQGAATSGVTGRLEDIDLQRGLEHLGQKNSLVGLTGVPTNLEGFLTVRES
jgi:hypothetical protein